MTEHTKLPWRIERVSRFGEYDVLGANGEQVAACYVTDGADEPEEYPSEANAAFIVKACNAHEDLVKALRHARADLEAARTLAREVLGEPHGINQTIDLVDAALKNADPASPVASAQRGGE